VIRGVPSWDAADIDPDKRVPVLEPCSDLAFAVNIESNGYQPALSSSAVLVVDPALKDAIQHSDVVCATLGGRLELLQALHKAPATLSVLSVIENPATPAAVRAELKKILEHAPPERTWLVYRHLDDGRQADMSEMRIIGPVIQKTEGRGWASITRATIEHARPTMAEMLLQGGLDPEPNPPA
jgi:hypothetical protein